MSNNPHRGWTQLAIYGADEEGFRLHPIEEAAEEDEDALGQLFTSLVCLQPLSDDGGLGLSGSRRSRAMAQMTDMRPSRASIARWQR